MTLVNGVIISHPSEVHLHGGSVFVLEEARRRWSRRRTHFCGHNLRLTRLQWWHFREHVHLLRAFRLLLALHLTFGLGAQLRVLALPFAHGLCAHVSAGLLVFSAYHFACRLATFCLAGSAVFGGAKVLWAYHFTLWFATFHLAAICVETLAACGARGLIAYRTALLIAHWGIATPRAHWCAVLWLALLLHARAPFFPAAIAMKVAAIALCLRFERWWSNLFSISLDLSHTPCDRSFHFSFHSFRFTKVATM
jgi:hypothetical protein